MKNEKNYKNIFWIIIAAVKKLARFEMINEIFASNFKPVSLGGWCGPTRAIREVSLDPQAYPFDYIRTTFEGVCKFLEYDFKDFFPEKPWISEKIIGFDVYRGKYASFWYHDITNPKTIEAFKRRIERFTNLLKKTKKTIIFIRVVVDRDPVKEFSQMQAFDRIIRKKFPNLKYKFVFIIHGQKIRTLQIQPINDKTAVWCVDRSRKDGIMDIIDYKDGYKKIIDFVIRKNNWPPKPEIVLIDIKKDNDLWLVDGIPMVK